MPLHLVDHPLTQDALVRLRDKRTTPEQFRLAARRITFLLAAEALRDIPVSPVTVDTPLAVASGRILDADIVLVPVLRAGLGMLDAVLELIPTATVGHVGLQRDEQTAVASTYYARFPPTVRDSLVLIVDPMLATGGSACAAIDLVKAAGAREVRLVCIVAAPEGIAHVASHHPDVRVYTPVVDTALDERKYIVPGLGDFGDRLYGTL